jgi:energy-coupling factor transporter ATP-binding protein EcfA2
MSEKEYTDIFTTEFPGLEMQYLKLLIAAKGVSEGQLAQCPVLMINGPSGSGKSTVPGVAAGICGDKSEEPIFVPDTVRFRQSLMDAAQNSSFVVVNEIFKSAEQARMSPVQALNWMLSLTPDSRSHVMYIGSVSFGKLPVFVLTDIDTPNEVLEDIQIARRFVTYRLQRRNYWEDSFTARGIRPHEFRLISTQHAKACDSILSDVTDEFFQTPMSLKDIAQKLMNSRVELEEEVNEPEPEDTQTCDLKRLYQLVCNAPDISGSDAMRYRPAMGWKRVNKGDQTELAHLWQELVDPNCGNFSESRIASSVDWCTILGIELPIDSKGARRGIMLQRTPYGKNGVYLRFVNADIVRNASWVNGKIVKAFK